MEPGTQMNRKHQTPSGSVGPFLGSVCQWKTNKCGPLLGVKSMFGVTMSNLSVKIAFRVLPGMAPAQMTIPGIFGGFDRGQGYVQYV